MMKSNIPQYQDISPAASEAALTKVRETLRNPRHSKTIESLTSARKSNILTFDDIEANILKPTFKSILEQEALLAWLFDRSRDSRCLDVSLLISEFCPQAAESDKREQRGMVVREEKGRRQYDAEFDVDEGASEGIGRSAQIVKDRQSSTQVDTKLSDVDVKYDMKAKNEADKKEAEKKEAVKKAAEKKEADKKAKDEAEKKQKEEREKEERKKKEEKDQEEKRLQQEKKEKDEKAKKDKEEKEKKDREEKEKRENEEKERREKEKKDLEEKERKEREAKEKKEKEEKEKKERADKEKKEKEAKEKREKEEEAEQKRLEEQMKAEKNSKDNKKYAKNIDDFLDDFQEPDEEVVQAKPQKKEAPKASRDEQAVAATKIQASYRGKRDRSKVDAMRLDKAEDEKRRAEDERRKEEQRELDELANEPGMDQAALKIQASFRGKQDRKKVEEEKEKRRKEEEEAKRNKEQKELEELANEPGMDQAALKIQASFRGKQDRKKVEEEKEKRKKEEEEKRKEEENRKLAEQKELDELAQAPGMDQAALKIQASFRGKQDRKKVEEEKDRKKREDEERKKLAEQKELEELAEAPGMDDAALKIQAAFRGKQDRKRVDELRQSENPAKEQKKNGGKMPTPPKIDDFADDEFDFLDESKPKESSPPVKKDVTDAKKDSKADQLKSEKDELEELANEPGMDQAALKIQASFRGKQDRKKVEEIKKSKQEEKGGSDGRAKAQAGEGKHQQGTLEDDFDDEFGMLDDDSKPKKQAAGNTGQTTDKSGKNAAQKTEAQELEELANEPGMDQAALKIQASFRGKKDREKIEAMKKEKDLQTKANENRTKEDHRKNLPSIVVTPDGRSKDSFEYKETEKKKEVSVVDRNSEMDKAATKIQASFRGKQGRTRVEQIKEEKKEADREKQKMIEQEERFRKLDEEKRRQEAIEEQQRAAVKIQFAFRGKQDRNKIIKMKEAKKPAHKVTYQEAFAVKTTKEQEEAALRIQSAYRGKRDRQRVVEIKKNRAQPTQNREDSNRLKSEAGQEEYYNEYGEEELIPGKVDIILDQLFINEVIDLQEGYSISVLVKAGDYSRLI